MPPLVAAAAGGRPERASSWTILCDLQACISEPVRIIHYALDGVRRLLCNRGTERGRESAVNTTVERTGESPAAKYADYNQQRADDGPSDADDNGLSGDDDDLHGREDDDRSNSDDYDNYHEEVDEYPPPSRGIVYEGDSCNIRIAYSFSRYLVELLSVRPRFPFEGTFIAFNDCSAYRFSPQNGPQYRNVDSQGNLLLCAHGGAM